MAYALLVAPGTKLVQTVIGYLSVAWLWAAAERRDRPGDGAIGEQAVSLPASEK